MLGGGFISYKNCVILDVSMQEDGWYLASTRSKKLHFVTESKTYEGLRERVREGVDFHIGGEYKKYGLSDKPMVKLVFKRIVNPAAKKGLSLRVCREQSAYTVKKEGFCFKAKSLSALLKQIEKGTSYQVRLVLEDILE